MSSEAVSWLAILAMNLGGIHSKQFRVRTGTCPVYGSLMTPDSGSKMPQKGVKLTQNPRLRSHLITTVSRSVRTANGSIYWEQEPGPNFMALLTVGTESALTEAVNSVLTASPFHGLTVGSI